MCWVQKENELLFQPEEERYFPIILHLMGLPSQDVSQAQRQSEGERVCMEECGARAPCATAAAFMLAGANESYGR